MGLAKRILIIEDDPFLAKLYLETIKVLGVDVDVAMSKNDAIDKLQSYFYNLALIDIMLSDNSKNREGEDVVDFISEKLSKTKIVVISATDDIGVAVRLFRKGILDYLSKKDIRAKEDYLKIIRDALRDDDEAEKNGTMRDRTQSRSRIFVVHGHDEAVKAKVARFIEKIGHEPIIIQEQGSSGKTIIEKIEGYSDVSFGIVLLTPDDIGSLRDDKENLRFRARQNVVFEHGYLIGKLGRKKVCALIHGSLEIPSDLDGIAYIRYDDADAWSIGLAREMRNAGILVDMNKVI